jgi:signal peptidase II
MIDSYVARLRMGACTRRSTAASPGTKASGLGTDRVDTATWCMPSPQAPTQESIICASAQLRRATSDHWVVRRADSLQRHQLLLFFAVAACLATVDLATKSLVRAYLATGRPEHLGPLLLDRVQNPGIGLGSLAHGGPAVVTAGLILLAVALGVAFVAVGNVHRLAPLALAAAEGGVLGNLLDRLGHNGITDFVSIGTLPIFNLADALLLVGLLTTATLGLFVSNSAR